MIVFRIHHGNTPLQEGFQKDLAEKGRLAQNASSTAVMGSGPGLNQKEEASWVAAFGAHCFLTVDAMWPVASHSCRHALPTMMDYTPSRLGGLRNLPPRHGFCQECCHSNTKSYWSVALPRIKSCSALENELVKSPYPIEQAR